MLLLAAGAALGQGTVYKRKHLEFYDTKPIHYGFFFGLPTSHFSIRHNDNYLKAGTDSTLSVTSPSTIGFRMGFLMNVYLSPRFDLRVSPLTLSLYGRGLDYLYNNGGQKRQLRESTWAEFPIMLKYKSERRGNTRMYAVAGLRAGIEANVRRNSQAARRNGVLPIRSTDLSIEYGVGLERFFEYFKFTPELHFSHGLLNMADPTGGLPAQGISRLRTHTVTLYLMFD